MPVLKSERDREELLISIFVLSLVCLKAKPISYWHIVGAIVGVGVTVGVAVRVGVRVGVLVGVAVRVGVGEGVLVGVGVGVAEHPTRCR